jgi:hypothetical protein
LGNTRQLPRGFEDLHSLPDGDAAPQAPEGGVELSGAPDDVYDLLLEAKRRVLYGLHPL